MGTNESAIDALVALGVPLGLQTGLPVIDEVLSNNLQYGEISEIMGDAGTGKTQLCYALVTHFLFHTTFNVAWLDSNGSFRAHRLVEYAKGSGETIDKTFEALERVTIARVSDHKQLIEILGLIDDYFVEYCIRLVIIDGVFEMCDERLFGENVRRSSIMGVILNKINTLTEAGCTVVTTCSQKDHESELTRNWIQQIQRSILVENDSKVRGVRVLKVKDSSQNCGRFKISSRGLRAEYS